MPVHCGFHDNTHTHARSPIWIIEHRHASLQHPQEACCSSSPVILWDKKTCPKCQKSTGGKIQVNLPLYCIYFFKFMSSWKYSTCTELTHTHTCAHLYVRLFFWLATVQVGFMFTCKQAPEVSCTYFSFSLICGKCCEYGLSEFSGVVSEVGWHPPITGPQHVFSRGVMSAILECHACVSYCVPAWLSIHQASFQYSNMSHAAASQLRGEIVRHGGVGWGGNYVLLQFTRLPPDSLPRICISGSLEICNDRSQTQRKKISFASFSLDFNQGYSSQGKLKKKKKLGWNFLSFGIFVAGRRKKQAILPLWV